MKIAVFTEGYDPFINGVVTTIGTLQRVLQQRGHEVVIFAPAYPGHQDHNGDVVRLPSLRWSKIGYPSLSPLARCHDVLARGSFDIVHSHHPFTMSRLAVRMARRHDLPLIYSFHTMLTEYAHYVPVLRSPARRFVEWTFVRHCAEADYVTAPTAIIRQFLRERGVKTPIAVVPTPVPPLRPAPDGREGVRRQLGVPPGVPLLFYAGRLAKEKQLDFLLRAVARLRPAHDFRLCLAGGGPSERELHKLSVKLGIADRILFAGWVPYDEMPDRYAAADLFVFPSTTDTFGLVLVEAMSVGLPCVAVDKYGPREIVIEGETGFIVPFKEPAFADAVACLLAGPALRSRMGQAARQRAKDFGPGPVTGMLCSVYDEARMRRSAAVRSGRKSCGWMRRNLPWSA